MPSGDHHPEMTASSENAAFAAELSAFSEALEMLYIPSNRSGRIRFREKWPAAASYIFSQELTRYDYEGTVDSDQRMVLEKEAEKRRLDILETLPELRKSSVQAGALQPDYIRSIIDRFGIRLATCLYAENILQRIRPDLLKQMHEESQKTEDTERSDKNLKNMQTPESEKLLKNQEEDRSSIKTPDSDDTVIDEKTPLRAYLEQQNTEKKSRV